MVERPLSECCKGHRWSVPLQGACAAATADMTVSKQPAESSVTCARMHALMYPCRGGTPAQNRSMPPAQARAMVSCWPLAVAGGTGSAGSEVGGGGP
jgi:hypothetical protein